MKISILTKYIWRESVLFIGMCLALFTIILFTVQMLRLASLVINRGVGLTQVGAIALSIVPTFLEIAFPLASMLGVMLAFARLSGDSELVVLRASGISFLQLLKPIVALSLVLATCTLGISIYLKPWGYRTLNSTLLDIARSKSTAALQPGFFSKMGDLTVYCEEIDTSTGRAEKILIEDRRIAQQPKIILSQRGVISSDPVSMSVRLFLDGGEIHEVVENRYTVTSFDSNSITLESSAIFDENQTKGQSARELTLTELTKSLDGLRQILKQLTQDGASPQTIVLPENLQSQLRNQEITPQTVKRRIIRNRIEYGFRFAIPTACMLLTVLGMTLGIQPSRMQRNWGGGLSLMLGLGVFMLYYGLLSLGITLAEGGKLSPPSGVWLPIVTLIVANITICMQLHREKWGSAIEGLLNAGGLIRNLVVRQPSL